MLSFPSLGNGYIEADELDEFLVSLLQEMGNEVSNKHCIQQKYYRYIFDDRAANQGKRISLGANFSEGPDELRNFYLYL